MANTTKVAVVLATILVLLLQVFSHAAGRHFRDTPAVMSLAGGFPVSCDGKHHNDGLFLAAVTSRWYAGRCGKMIRIRSSAGLAVEAMVVDECDIEQGCGDSEISAPAAVWKALRVHGGGSQVSVNVTWSDLN